MLNKYEIEEIKKNKDKYTIVIDSKKLNVTEDDILKFDLFIGKELNEAEYLDLIDSIQYNMLLSKTLKYITYQPRSKKEIDVYFKKCDVNEKIKDKVLNILIEYKYINDDELAESIYEYEKNIKKKGPKAIKQKLLLKGVSKEKIMELISLYDEKMESENIEYIVDKEVKKNQRFPIKKRKRIILDKLIRDGFSQDLVYDKVEGLKLEDESYSELLKEVDKLKKKYCKEKSFQAKQKIINNLINKGFEYSMICKVLNSDETLDFD